MAKDNLYQTNISTIVPALGSASATHSSPVSDGWGGGDRGLISRTAAGNRA